MESDPFYDTYSSEEKVFVETLDNNSEVVESPRGAPKRKRRPGPRPRIAFSWSDEDTIKLIGKVEAHASIWDFKSGAYKYRSKREKAWRAIAAQFKNQISVEQLCAKWQNLRSQFRKSMPDKTKSGQVGRPPFWKFYRYMAFVTANEQQQNVRPELTVVHNCMKMIFFYNAVAVGRFNGR